MRCYMYDRYRFLKNAMCDFDANDATCFYKAQNMNSYVAYVWMTFLAPLLSLGPQLIYLSS